MYIAKYQVKMFYKAHPLLFRVKFPQYKFYSDENQLLGSEYKQGGRNGVE